MPVLAVAWLLLVRLALAAGWTDAALARETPAHPEPDYHYAAELYREIALVARERPGVVEPFLVGHSTQDRPIWGFRVHDPTDAGPRRKILVFANIHALEWIPSEIALAWLLDLAARPRPGVEAVIVPVLNPDGRARVEEDLSAGRNVYRRGNGAVGPDGRSAPVDLNRDFAVNREVRAAWEPLLPGRYGHSAAALSQPESQALDRLADAERFDVAISLHAFGGFLYYPWSGRWARPRDWRTFQELGLAMQDAMGAHAYRPRQLARWGFFFRAQGSELDHLYGRYGAYTFLVETTRSGLSPVRPADWKVNFRWYNPRDPAPHVNAGVSLLRGLLARVASGDLPAPTPPPLPPQEPRGSPSTVGGVGGSAREPGND